MKHLGKLIFAIQQGYLQGIITNKESIPAYIGREWDSYARVLSIDKFTIKEKSGFDCLITIKNKWDIGELEIAIDEKTNAGMGEYDMKNK